MNRERLTRLITILEAVPADRFDMHIWRNACGTAGCAAGWAALDPVFNAQGFHLSSMDCPIFGEDTPTAWLNSWEHVAKFFGLDYEDGQRLFNAIYYTDDEGEENRFITPQDVITRIHEMLGTLAAPPAEVYIAPEQL